MCFDASGGDATVDDGEVLGGDGGDSLAETDCEFIGNLEDAFDED